MEKRHNYVRKVAETAVGLFIANDKVLCSEIVGHCLANYFKKFKRIIFGNIYLRAYEYA